MAMASSSACNYATTPKKQQEQEQQQHQPLPKRSFSQSINSEKRNGGPRRSGFLRGESTQKNLEKERRKLQQGLWTTAMMPTATTTTATAVTAAAESISTTPNESRLPQQGNYKIVYLIRHGESLGQIAPTRLARQTDASLWDCGLSPRGIQQAQSLKQQLCTTASNTTCIRSQIQLVLCSPLTRALQTACLVFGTEHDNEHEQDNNTTSSSSSPVTTTPKILVHYHLREIGSMIPENMPRPVTVVQQSLLEQAHIDKQVVNALDFDTLLPRPPSDHPSSVWPRQANDVPIVVRRDQVQQTLAWIATCRPETCIAMVCHYHVIRAALYPTIVTPTKQAKTPTRPMATPRTPLRNGAVPSHTTPWRTPPPPHRTLLAAFAATSSPMRTTSTSTTTPRPRPGTCSSPSAATAVAMHTPSRPLPSDQQLHPANASLIACRLCCITGRLSLLDDGNDNDKVRHDEQEI